MVRPLRTLRSTRGAHSFHDQLRRLANFYMQGGLFRIIGKTSSTHAAALAVPPAIRPDQASRSRARSEQLRSMFSVFVSLFRAFPSARERLPGNAKVGVFTARSLEHDCSARACGPDEPGGGPGGPGGEAQWPDGGSTAWTERAASLGTANLTSLEILTLETSVRWSDNRTVHRHQIRTHAHSHQGTLTTVTDVYLARCRSRVRANAANQTSA